MNIFRASLLGLLLSCGIGTQVSAIVPNDDYTFQQDRMQLTSDSVIVISSFDNQDHVTAYTHYGIRLWNNPFHAKILSWAVKGDMLFVFSKDRNGHKTYLTCVDRYTGALLWQKP